MAHLCDGGKLSNFRKLLACAVPKDATLPNFAEKLLQMATTQRNSRKVSPSKVSRFTVANTEVFYRGNFGKAKNITFFIY